MIIQHSEGMKIRIWDRLEERIVPNHVDSRGLNTSLQEARPSLYRLVQVVGLGPEIFRNWHIGTKRPTMGTPLYSCSFLSSGSCPFYFQDHIQKLETGPVLSLYGGEFGLCLYQNGSQFIKCMCSYLLTFIWHDDVSSSPLAPCWSSFGLASVTAIQGSNNGYVM